MQTLPPRVGMTSWKSRRLADFRSPRLSQWPMLWLCDVWAQPVLRRCLSRPSQHCAHIEPFASSLSLYDNEAACTVVKYDADRIRCLRGGYDQHDVADVVAISAQRR